MAPPSSSSSSSSAASSKTAVLRLMADLKAICTDAPEGGSASPVSDEDLFLWRATVFGPYETPWEGGVFELELKFPDSYPQKPPAVRFTSEIFHPNVSTEGVVCMDIIRNAWSPCHNVCSILTSIQSLLTDPNPSKPRNHEAARLFLNDIQTYNKIVRLCARKSTEGA